MPRRKDQPLPAKSHFEQIENQKFKQILEEIALIIYSHVSSFAELQNPLDPSIATVQLSSENRKKVANG